MQFTKVEKQAFVLKFEDSIKAIITEGYDCEEAIVLDTLLKTKHGYSNDTSRRTVLIPFTKMYCDVVKPGNIVVASKQFSSVTGKTYMNEEVNEVQRRRDDRIMNFISMSDRVNR